MRWTATLIATICLALDISNVTAGPYAPAAGQTGSTAIPHDSPLFREWASGVESLTRGPTDINQPALGNASFGTEANVLGPASTDTLSALSLGDGGQITLSFEKALRDGPGADFAVFENSFGDTFLELAFVEVSSDGANFFRFPSVSLTQTSTQVGGFGMLDPTNLYDLAGKYRIGFGTPFDLAELSSVSSLLDLNDVRFVRLVDVVGTIGTNATHDSLGNIVNDPYSTPFGSGGFDLEAVGVIHRVPEPATWQLVGAALVAGFAWRWRRFRRTT